MDNVTTITIDNLREEITKLRDEGWRFITLSAVDLNESEHEILYQFHSLSFELKSLRLTFPKGTVVPSISPIIFAALLVENEIKDLFHIDFEGLVLDYKGTFYTNLDELDEGSRMSAPFATFTTVQKNKE